MAGYSFMVQALTDHIKSYSGQQNSSVVNVSSISAHQTQPNRSGPWVTEKYITSWQQGAGT